MRYLAKDRMPDLLWSEVKSFFDPDQMGALPDVYVPDAAVEDWQALFDLIRSRGWEWKYAERDSTRQMPYAAEIFSRSPDEGFTALHVWPVPGVAVVFLLETASEIDFQVDLRELQGQAGVDTLFDFLCTIGRRLGKPVLMCGEFGSRIPVLGFDPTADCVVLLADP
ncbi:hypothetical protein ACWCW7_07195 [Nocardia tengchongensis]